MPIQEQDIVFVRSQVMDDVPEGGGAATGTVIVDGQMNNVFEDISDLDRAYGRFNLRKIFLAVRTLSTDLYGGAKTVITALPTDPALNFAVFANKDAFDTRSSAANKVAAYLYKGPTWAGYLHENHITGMRAINIIQRVGTTLPPVGKTLTLVQDEGLVGEKEQYVRVTKVDAVERTFTDADGDFIRLVVTLTLSDALRFNFTGHSALRQDASISYTGKTRLRDTVVADATRYYGAQRLAAAAGIGDITLRAQSIFTQLVPSAQTETPLVNQTMNPDVVATYSAGDRTVEVAQQAHTRALDVTPENRRLNWIETLLPIPAPKALSIAFVSQGNWYVLKDDGTGALTSTDTSIGAGTVSYTTGSVVVTLGALPDAGSQIMLTWASPVHYAVRAGATAAAGTTLDARVTLAHAPVVPGSVSISYPVGGAGRTVADTGGTGTLTGSGASGTIDYATGNVVLRFTAPPDFGAALSCDYTWRNGDVMSGATGTISGGQFTVPGAAPFRKSGGFTLVCNNAISGNLEMTAYVTSAGDVRVTAGKGGAARRVMWADQIAGSFDATTGVVTLLPTLTLSAYQWDIMGKIWSPLVETATPVTVSSIEIERDTNSYSPSAVTGEEISLALGGLALDLLVGVVGTIVPGSVRFAAAGKTFEDRSGTLYADINPTTGSGTPAGSIDYAAGIVTIRLWGSNAAAAPSVSACLVRYGTWTAVEASFRAALAPIKPQALSINATALDGTALSASADENGAIAGAKARGQVNYQFGTAVVEFGQLVGGVWQPVEVIPETIRYNAVAYSYLPLDADILGIDPVRLPSDGRVPVFRAGDVVMVMHAAETAPATVSAGGTIDCGRQRIGWVRVIDATGATVPTGYTLDRAAGVVTMTSISGVTMPVRVRHTVGDLRQITDVQITGELSLSRPLSHTFPAGEALVASCLIHGDRRARVSAAWDQATWSGSWSDSIIGSEAIATLDTIAHPIEVTNEGAETERWLLRWTSTTNVELIGERRGLVYSGPFTSDIAPINPRTRNTDGTGGVPYLRIPVAANGGGWSAGNCVRINTVGALADIWVARSIQQSEVPAGDGADGIELYALGNIDRP